jgi:transcriptional regulator with XRE-family HTH domain
MTATPHLPQHIQELIQLREINGITLEQVANEMGLTTPAAVRKRLEEGPSTVWVNRYKRAIELILVRRKSQLENLKTI